MKLFVETKEGTDSFYLDEAFCAVEGTMIEGAGQPEFTLKGDVNADQVFDLTLMKRMLLAS